MLTFYRESRKSKPDLCILVEVLELAHRFLRNKCESSGVINETNFHNIELFFALVNNHSACFLFTCFLIT